MMFEKWLRAATLWSPDADDGGGGEAPMQDGDVGEDSSGETGAEPTGEAEPSSPAPEATAEPAEPAVISFPNALSDIFTPKQPSDTSVPPPGSSSTDASGPAQPTGHEPPAAGPQRPNRDLAVTDPVAYAEQLEAYFESRLEQQASAAQKPVQDLRAEMQKEREQQFIARVDHAAAEIKDALPRHWEKILNRDKDFRENKELQAAVQDIIGYYVSGNLQKGNLQNLEYAKKPEFTRRALLIAKDELGVGDVHKLVPGGGPAPVGRQGPASPGPKVDPEISDAVAEAAREGFTYTPEQIQKAMKNRYR